MVKFIRLVCLITAVVFSTVESRAQLFVANVNSSSIGEYKSDGTVISSALVTVNANSNNPYGLLVSGTNIYTCSPGGTVAWSTDDGAFRGDIIYTAKSAFLGIGLSGTNMYVADSFDGLIIKYSIAFGGVANLVTDPLVTGFASPSGGIVVVDTNLYVADTGNNSVGLFSTTGTVINRSFITGLHSPVGLAIVGTNLYVANIGNNTVGHYSTLGQTLNAAMITGLNAPVGLASDGTNLFVSNYQDPNGSVGSYTLTGATNNAALITGLRLPAGLAYRSSSGPSVALSAAVSGGNVTLSWPVTGVTFRLRQNTNLATTNWVNVTNVPNVIGGAINQVTLSVTNNTFFDLVNP